MPNLWLANSYPENYWPDGWWPIVTGTLTPVSTTRQMIWDVRTLSPITVDQDILWNVNILTSLQVDRTALWDVRQVAAVTQTRDALWDVNTLGSTSKTFAVVFDTRALQVVNDTVDMRWNVNTLGSVLTSGVVRWDVNTLLSTGIATKIILWNVEVSTAQLPRKLTDDELARNLADGNLLFEIEQQATWDRGDTYTIQVTSQADMNHVINLQERHPAWRIWLVTFRNFTYQEVPKLTALGDLYFIRDRVPSIGKRW